MMKDTMDLAQLWRAWPIAGAWRLSPLSGGTNNLVWRAETTDEERYVLRLFPDLTQLPRLRYEAALLRALSNRVLPFRLPLPITTHSGEGVIMPWPGVDHYRLGDRFLHLQEKS